MVDFGEARGNILTSLRGRSEGGRVGITSHHHLHLYLVSESDLLERTAQDTSFKTIDATYTYKAASGGRTHTRCTALCSSLRRWRYARPSRVAGWLLLIPEMLRSGYVDPFPVAIIYWEPDPSYITGAKFSWVRYQLATSLSGCGISWGQVFWVRYQLALFRWLGSGVVLGLPDGIGVWAENWLDRGDKLA